MKTKKQLTLIDELITAKEEEKLAIQKRIDLENEIFNLYKNDLKKSEGQETIEELGYKITINQPANYKLDEDKYRKLCESLPEELQFHRVKLDLDKVQYELTLLHVDNKIKKQIRDCVTMKYGKISVVAERLLKLKI
jgi:hypothetical protein